MFPSHNPFPASSDRYPKEWLAEELVFAEPGSAHRHVRKTHRATGQAWMCIESAHGLLLAEFTLGNTDPRVTLIHRAHPEGPDLGRKTYALQQGCEPPERIRLDELRELIRSGVRSSRIVLISGEDAPIPGPAGSAAVRQWETVWSAKGEPLGNREAVEEYSAAGSLTSREMGNLRTEFDPDAPFATPLVSTDRRTGERAHTFSVDLIGARGGKVRVVEEGKPLGFWQKLKSRLHLG